MAHFTGESSTGQQIYLAHSTDGLHWTDLNNGSPVLLSTVGTRGVRDPAPEAIWNPATNDYVIYWATNVPNNGATKHRIFYTRTTNFRTVTPSQPYITRPGGQEIIDTQIVEVPAGVGKYRYVRASGDGQITLEGSNSIHGTWKTLGNLSGIGLTGAQVEGPMWTKFDNRNEWVLYLDQYSSGRGYLPVLTTNPSSPATFRLPATGSYDMGANRKRHGTILNLTAAEQTRVLARWPGSAANLATFRVTT